MADETTVTEKAELLEFYTEGGTSPTLFEIHAPEKKGERGLVYIVKNDQGQPFAIKECLEPQNRDIFKSNSQKLLEQKLDHCVDVLAIGYLDEEKTRPAILMNYAGSDLKEVYEHFPGVQSKVPDDQRVVVSNNVQEAFRYKVVLTILEMMEKAHKKKLWHGDLKPGNTVCGFKLGDYLTKPEELEQKLIQSEILLCDRTTKEELGTLLGSLGGENRVEEVRFNIYFTAGTSNLTPQERDIYAALAHFAWLENKHTEESLEEFLKATGLGIELKYNRTAAPGEKKRVYPNATEIRKKIEEKIEKEGFFIIETGNSTGGKSYPLVLRPLDEFRERVQKLDELLLPTSTETITEDCLKKFYKDHKYSYTRLLNRDGGKKVGDEVALMKKLFSSTMVKVTEKLDREIGRKAQEVIQLKEEQSKLEKEISTLTGTITRKEKEIDAEDKKYQHAHVSWCDALVDEPEKAGELERTTEMSKQKIGQYALEKGKMKKKKEGLVLQNNDIRQKIVDFDYNIEIGAIAYVRQICLEGVIEDEQQRMTIEKIVAQRTPPKESKK